MGCVRLAAFEGRQPLPLLDEEPVLILDGVPQGSDLRDELGEGVRGWQGIAIGRAHEILARLLGYEGGLHALRPTGPYRIACPLEVINRLWRPHPTPPRIAWEIPVNPLVDRGESSQICAAHPELGRRFVRFIAPRISLFIVHGFISCLKGATPRNSVNAMRRTNRLAL